MLSRDLAELDRRELREHGKACDDHEMPELHGRLGQFQSRIPKGINGRHARRWPQVLLILEACDLTKSHIPSGIFPNDVELIPRPSVAGNVKYDIFKWIRAAVSLPRVVSSNEIPALVYKKPVPTTRGNLVPASGPRVMATTAH